MLRTLVLAVVIVIAAAAPAAAHVTVQPPTVEAGGFTKLAFRTPNERDDASTTKLEVFFPEDQPLFSVSVKPVAGWEATTEMRTLDEPVEVFGEPRTEAVSTITWEGGAIEPGQFQEFEVSVGPLPEEPGQLIFKAIQTYSSGEVVRWIEEPTEDGEEPELPAPVVELVAPEDGEAAPPAAATAGDDTGDGDDDDDGTDPIAVAALVVALAAAGLALAGLLRRRS